MPILPVPMGQNCVLWEKFLDYMCTAGHPGNLLLMPLLGTLSLTGQGNVTYATVSL